MGDFFRGRRGALSTTGNEERYKIWDKYIRTGMRTDTSGRRPKKVQRLIEGGDPSRNEDYIKEGRYEEWNRYLQYRKEEARQDPRLEANPGRAVFEAFTVENRPRNAAEPSTFLPIKKSVTYAPNQPKKSQAGGCKYGKHMEAGRIFCFRNPNHHKLPRGQADRSKIRTAEQINRVRNRNRAPAEEEDEGEAEPDRIRGRGGMRTPSIQRGRKEVVPVVPRRSARLRR